MEQIGERVNNLQADIRNDLNSFTLPRSEQMTCTRTLHVLALPDLAVQRPKAC